MRLGWDKYYMDMAFYIAIGSIDQSTKCGCIIVNDHHEPLAMGFNGPPQDCNDELMPFTRPEKYDCTIHAEENAVLASTVSLEGATAYVTAPPCEKCFRALLRKRIKRIVHGPSSTNMQTIYKPNSFDLTEAAQFMNEGKKGPKIDIVPYAGVIGEIMFKDVKEYMLKKYGTCIINTNDSLTIDRT